MIHRWGPLTLYLKVLPPNVPTSAFWEVSTLRSWTPWSQCPSRAVQRKASWSSSIVVCSMEICACNLAGLQKSWRGVCNVIFYCVTSCLLPTLSSSFHFFCSDIWPVRRKEPPWLLAQELVDPGPFLLWNGTGMQVWSRLENAVMLLLPRASWVSWIPLKLSVGILTSSQGETHVSCHTCQ